MRKIIYLILVNSPASSSVQPWVQPENANISISYRRWRTRNGPFCRRILITLFPSSSIWEVKRRALKFTRQRSFWISGCRPLLASRESVLFKCNTLCFRIRGRIYIDTEKKSHQTIPINSLKRNANFHAKKQQKNLMTIIREIWPTNWRHWVNHSQIHPSLQPWG